MSPDILHETDRLYTRNWQLSDLDLMIRLNSDELVMNHFPKLLTDQESEAFLHKMIKLFEKRTYAYLPVFEKDQNSFIGFVGLADQYFDNKFFVDIGWRLLPEFWGKGYATEMARKWLNYGFLEKKLDEIAAIAPLVNKPSILLMQKLGLQHKHDFLHPKLSAFPSLHKCTYYTITHVDYNSGTY